MSNSHGINNALVERSDAAMYSQQVGQVCLGANRFCQVLPAGKNNYGLKVRLLCALNQTCLWALKHRAKLNSASIQNKGEWDMLNSSGFFFRILKIKTLVKIDCSSF